MRKLTDLQEIKSIELEILRKVHDFCVEKRIRYYLIYGTLLGAVRHQGFIPWDDDIDIAMPRTDYERFILLFPVWAENNGLFLAGPTIKTHFFPEDFYKVCDARTRASEEMLKYKNQLGVFIDIFPLNNCPNEKKEKNLYIRRVKRYYKMILANALDVNSEETKTRYSVIKRFIIRILNTNSPQKWLEKKTEFEKRYRGIETNYYIDYTGTRVMPKKWFEESVLLPFEKYEFYAPKNYDDFLKFNYGDYLILPPEEQRKPHHMMDVEINEGE